MTRTGRRIRPRDDAGTLSLSTTIVVPLLFGFLAMAIVAGRVANTNGAVDSAANEGARAASISRSVASGQAAALAAADVSLSSAELDCTGRRVSTDLGALAAPVGQFGQVSVTVTCTVPMVDLPILNMANRTVTRTATSVVDPYRSRQ